MLERAAEQVSPRYDALVVDEALDFPDDWWLPLLTLLEEPDAGILYVFHHSNQAIYRRKGALPDKLLPAQIYENWRNTRAVFDTVMRYYSGHSIDCRGPAGPEVEWHEVSAQNLRGELGRVLHRIIREGQLSSRDVVVLVPRGVERSAVFGRCGAFNLTLVAKGRDDVQLSTIHRFKGLDAKAVVICEVSPREDEHFQQLLSVACSRARSLLVVLEQA